MEPLPQPAVFEPVGVGFGFDGVVLADGTITDLLIGYTLYSPVLYEVFASEAYLAGEAGDDETCATWGVFAPAPLEDPAALPTDDGTALFRAYDGTVPIEQTSCLGRVDPSWGEDASGLWGPWDGVRVGFGIGPQVDALAAEWSAEDLDAVGDALLSGWFAFEVTGTSTAAPSFVAHAWTSLVAYELDPITLDPLLDYDELGGAHLVPLDVSALAPGDALPPMYLRSTPITYSALAATSE